MGALARTAEAVAEVVAGLDRPPRALLVQADLKDPLPLATDGFDRVLCHNVLEVLPDHDALVAEAVRVLRPGGRLVLAHSDFDTLIFASEDLELTRRLVRAYCDTQQPWMDAVDGTIGRRLADIAGRAGLQVTDVQAQVVLGRRYLPGEIGWGYARNLADTLLGAGRADEAELELGRRERLGRALLDALADPTSVLDAQGRIVAVNQVWNLRSADSPAAPALGEVGQSYPAACQAAAAAGYDGLAAAADGVRGVLSGQAALFRCRYLTPDGAEPYEVSVTPLAKGDGAVVTHRAGGAVR